MISYQEYITSQLNKTFEYSEYIAQEIDNNISYAEYLSGVFDDRYHRRKSRISKIKRIFK